MKKYLSALFCFLILFLDLSFMEQDAEAQVTLTISKKFGEQIKIAVTPFDGRGFQAKHIASLIQRNLDFSGYFQAVPNPSFVIDQHKEDLKNGYIDFKGWQAISAEILIKGKVQAFGNDLEVSYEVFSTSDQKRIIGKALRSKKEETDYLAGVISDEILNKLTGNPAIFSKKIAFTTDYYKTKTIIVTDFSGKKRTRLFNENTLAITPKWFHKSEKLAYVSYRKKNPAIFILDLKTGRDQLAAHFPGLNANPDVAANDRFLAFTASRDGNPEVYVKDLKTNQYLRVTDNRSVDGDPTISIDGRSVAFVSNRYGTPQIFIQEGKSRPRRITYEGRYNTSPSWSPKGDMIAYASIRKSVFDIYVYDLKEGKSFPVVESRGNDDNPDWAADGRHLIFQSDRNGKSEIYAVDIFTRKEIPLINNFGKCENPAWQK